jgi:hypothetical protein
MRLSARMHGRHSARGDRKQTLMCPLCGQTGQPAGEESVVGFTLRGEDRGHPAWKCFVCGSGFAVSGANTEAIPADRWAQIEARYDRERQRAEETGEPLREKEYADHRT